MSALLARGKSDRLLAVTIFGMVLFGIVMIYSASVIWGQQIFGDDKFFMRRQIMWAILGCLGMALTANIPYQIWRKWAGAMFGVTFLLLISVLLFSRGEINGAHRWIEVGGLSFQPSELAKLTFIIYISAWLVRQKDEIDSIPNTFLPYLGVLIAISILILLQPDFGTLTIVLMPAIIIYFVAGLTWKQTLIGLLVAAVGCAMILSTEYRRERVMTFLNPKEDTAGAGYHIENISIAIGSGGLTGLGFGESKQKRLFLPEPHTDSIFAIISEELGALRSVIVIFLFCFIVYRGLRIGARVPDLFGQLMAVGITVWFGFQAFINLGSMLHLVPLVGVPLPFISYGGTNLVISLAAAGILLNISRSAQAAGQPAGPKARRRK